MAEGKSDTPQASGSSLADLLERMDWNYSASDREPSPLATTERFFRDFPWEGDGRAGDDRASDGDNEH